MGQCVSSKSAKGAIAQKQPSAPQVRPVATAPTAKHSWRTRMEHDYKAEDKTNRTLTSTRGQTTSFGFKRPTAVATIMPANINNTTTTEHQTTNIADSLESLVIAQPNTRTGTPRLARPKKDANGNTAPRTTRFGFRPPAAVALSNKVADCRMNNDTNSLLAQRLNSQYNTQRPELKAATIKLCSSSKSDSGRSTSSCEDSNKAGGLVGAGRFTLHSSQLPRPQCPIRIPMAARYHPPIAGLTHADKNAKTVANVTRKARSNHGSSASSVTDGDSGVGSQKSSTEGEPLGQGIEQLEASPSMKNRLRANVQKARPLEMVLTSAGQRGGAKRFELRELGDCIEVTETISLPLPPLPGKETIRIHGGGSLVRERAELYHAAVERDRCHRESLTIGLSGDEEEEDDDEDEGYEAQGEEKQHRDRLLSEKDELGCLGAGECEAGEELWGDDGCGDTSMPYHRQQPLTQADMIPEAVHSMNPPLRSVLLTIEDPAFATLAAMSSSQLIADETMPEFGTSPPSSLSLDPPPPPSNEKQATATLSPDSPGTPTQASNSLSLSLSEGRERDFLIDDEIADQPGLTMMDDTLNTTAANSSGQTLMQSSPHDDEVTSTIPADLANKTGELLNRLNRTFDINSPRFRSLSHTNSVGTLSPCESIASDDLMIMTGDDRSETSSNFDDCHADQRLESGALSELAEAAMFSELEQQKEEVFKEWSNLLSTHSANLGTNGVRGTPRFLRSRVGSTASGADSPRSLDTPRTRSGLSSPLRVPRQATSSPGDDISDDSGIKMDRGTYQHMYQDVINIKTMLLRLKRVLQESDTINPFDSTLKNGLCYNLSNSEAQCDDTTGKLSYDTDIVEEVTDLRRQVVFLQQQLEEKDRTIRQLQGQIVQDSNKTETHHGTLATRHFNATTQTDRVRPLSTGPSLLQAHSSDNAGGSLVSSLSSSLRLRPASSTHVPAPGRACRRAETGSVNTPLPLPPPQNKAS